MSGIENNARDTKCTPDTSDGEDNSDEIYSELVLEDPNAIVSNIFLFDNISILSGLLLYNY